MQENEVEKEGLKEEQGNLSSLEYTKDSPTRSILKAISWRFIASGTTFLVTLTIFSNTSGHTMDEALETAWYVTVIEFTTKILFYYLHERMWTNIRWGKYWRRSYWKRRSWKKLYRQMHDNKNNQ